MPATPEQIFDAAFNFGRAYKAENEAERAKNQAAAELQLAQTRQDESVTRLAQARAALLAARQTLTDVMNMP